LTAARNRLRVIIGRNPEEIERVERERLINPLITVNAPIEGTVIARKVGPGQYVRSDTADPLYSIANLTTMWLKANVPENEIALIRVGQEIEIKVTALPDRAIKARISAIGAASDAATRRAVIGNATVNVGVEAAVRQGWDAIIGSDGVFVGMTGFGASAPYKDLYRHFGITPEKVAEAALSKLPK